ncbi:MAG: hypothetical protein HN600_01860 [Bacteroidetes bacterium]|jgi:antitoxin component YwqK of YwqJK toxin-antitoxin module|nr:hypothetical protein [Bacteroidota bacterium]
MKHIFIVFFLFFFATTCGGKVEVEYDEEIISIYGNGNKKLVNIFKVNGDRALIRKTQFYIGGGIEIEQDVNANGQKSGITTEYYENGLIKVSGYYSNNRKHGIFFWYDEVGKSLRTEEYKNGVKIRPK